MSGAVPSNSPPIAANPQVSSLWQNVVVIICYPVLISLLLLTRLFHDDLPAWVIAVNFWIASAYGLVITLNHLYTLQRLECRRVEIAARLTAIQPVSQECSLSLPFTIILRYHWVGMLPLPGWFIPAIVGLVLANVEESRSHSTSLLFVTIVMVLTGLLIVFIFGTLLGGFLAIEATDDDCKLQWRRRSSASEKRISWQDARLFVCYHLPSFMPGHQRDVIYQLYSQDKVISWTWYSDPRSPFTIMKPVLPVDEYHQQMQALVDLVVAKTGLELHDLSQ